MRFAVIAAMLIFALALLGWGWGTRRLLAMGAGRVSVTLALGLAAAIFLGGILNVAGLATAPFLAAFVAGGLVLAVPCWWRFGGDLRTQLRDGRWTALAVGTVALAILVFTIATQLPPSAYNAADDYAKYFFHPVRMLATGTLSGSAMSDLGSETLGGKAFLDGFVAAAFPLSYLNATDAVFGLFLCLMLAGGFAGGRNLIASLLCTATVILIDPQYMNISALYLGAALMMAAIALSADPREMDDGVKPTAVGLVYAGLVALKTTFALFVAVHFVFAVLAFALSSRGSLRFGAKVAGFGALFLSPWIALHAAHYYAALTEPVNELATYGYGPDEGLGLFSLVWLTYGSTILQFTLTVFAAFAAALFLGWKGWRAEGGERLSMLMGAAAGAAALAIYLIMFFVFGWQLSGHGEATRYFVPMGIAIVPAVLGLAASRLAGSPQTSARLVRTLAAAALAALPVAIFAPSLLPRIREAADYHFILAFPFAQSPVYANLNTLVLSSGMREHIRHMQHLVPPGQNLVVWINAPFDLDLSRNPVIDMDSAGLATPWATFPDTGYVIWEYGGYALPMAVRTGVEKSGIVGRHERMIAGAELKFSRELSRFAQEGAVLFDDKRFVVIRMPGS